MKAEVFMLLPILLGTLCNGFRDRYTQMKELLGRPGGLGIPLLPPDKRYNSHYLHRKPTKQLPLLPTDKRHASEESFQAVGEPINLGPDEKSNEDRLDSGDVAVSKRLALPDDGRPMMYKSSMQSVPFWRTWMKPRRIPLLPPDKRRVDFSRGGSNSVHDIPLDALDLSLTLGDVESAMHRKPLPLLPPDKKDTIGGALNWKPRRMRANKKKLLRADPVIPALDQKDKAVVNLIESASEVLHNLAEELKSYRPPVGFLYDDTDLGKRVPLLPYTSVEEPFPSIEDPIVKVIAEQEQEKARPPKPQSSGGLQYTEFDPTPTRKLPLLPFDKRTA